MSKAFISLGLILLIVGILWPWIARLGLGRLPGDIIIERDGMRFYFPIVSCILVSAYSGGSLGSSS